MAAPSPKLRTDDWREQLHRKLSEQGFKSLSKRDPLVEQALRDFSPIAKQSAFEAWVLRVEVASSCLDETGLFHAGSNLIKICPGDDARLCFAIALLRNGYTSKATEVLKGVSFEIPDQINNRLLCLLGTLHLTNLIVFNDVLIRAKHTGLAKMTQQLIDVIKRSESFGVSRDVLIEVQELAGQVARKHDVVISHAPDYEFDASTNTVFVFYRLPVSVETLLAMENDVFDILYKKRNKIPLDRIHLGFSVGGSHDLGAA